MECMLARRSSISSDALRPQTQQSITAQIRRDTSRRVIEFDDVAWFSGRIILRRVEDAIYLAREYFSSFLGPDRSLDADSPASSVAINNEKRTIDKRNLSRYLSNAFPVNCHAGVNVSQ